MTFDFNTFSIGADKNSGGGSITPTGTISITENGTYNVTNYASASVDVEGTEPTLTSITVTPSTTTQTITPTSGTDGYDTIFVAGVTASIDSDIQAQNIKSGVDILGVQGTVTELVGETATITTNGTYAPTVGNGFTSVSVNVESTAPVISTLTVTPTTTAQTFTAPTGTDGYSPVSVSAVTSSIDSNITAGNIKDGVTILGITGTLSGGGGGGNTVKRGTWIVPQEYLALDDLVKEYHNTYSAKMSFGLYFNRDSLTDNTYTFEKSSSYATMRFFTASGEITPSVVSSYYYSCTIPAGDNWLIGVNTSDNALSNFSVANIIPFGSLSEYASQKNAINYLCIQGAYNGVEFADGSYYLYSNLKEIHPLTNGCIFDFPSVTNRMKNFEYIPSTTEVLYGTATAVLYNSQYTLQEFGMVCNLPYGANLSTKTSYNWNFAADTSSAAGAFLWGKPRITQMYITIPPVNITMNGNSAWTYGIDLTADNWAYIAQNAPSVSGKTLTINAYNNEQLGATNKATLESKGWTVTVIQ